MVNTNTYIKDKGLRYYFDLDVLYTYLVIECDLTVKLCE